MKTLLKQDSILTTAAAQPLSVVYCPEFSIIRKNWGGTRVMGYKVVKR